MYLKRPFILRITLLAFLLTVILFTLNATGSHRLLITEFLALNSTGLQDNDGDYSDWIELYNPGETAVNLDGWALTDKADEPQQWLFPAITLNPGEYLVVYASGKDKRVTGASLHTNFKLSGGGEFLALIEPDSGLIAHAYDPFPAQQTDVSYGLYLNQPTYFRTPTPGEGNTLGTQVQAPLFSNTRGFYTDPVTVSLMVADPGTTIRYTTDGSRPTATYGQVYSAPLTISKTTPLSAVNVSNGLTSEVITHTYLFANDIVQQPDQPAGYPAEWGNYWSLQDPEKYAPADYGMDPDIVSNPSYQSLLPAALQSLPSLCIVTNPGYLFSHTIDPDTGGIYIYTGDVLINSTIKLKTLGADWERPTSVEYFDPASGKGFQINCGLRLHGGNSRKAMNSPKHSFRLSFRKKYGASKLNYKVFDQKGSAERFDHLVVRSTYNYAWIKDNSTHNPANSQYIKDQLAKQLHRDMGQISPHERPIHLYINGLYWGVYKLAEKLNNDFMSEYQPGEDVDFDVINDDEIMDGNNVAFKRMQSLASGSNYNSLLDEQLLDMDNYIDYMLTNYYIGNLDWDKNNWYTARNRVEPGLGFVHLVWDAETILSDVNLNLVKVINGELTTRFSNLSKNADFKLKVADRLYKHFYNDGALTPAHTVPLYKAMADEIDTAMVAESARWGDYLRDLKKVSGYPLYTLNDHWIPRRDYLLGQYLPQRSAIVLKQFKDAGYWPSVEPPVFNSKGGDLTTYHDLTMTAAKGSIYYTLDGSDPRTTGSSAIAPTASQYANALRIAGPGTIRARAKDGSTWSALAEISFQGGDTAVFVVGQSQLRLPANMGLHTIYTAGNELYATLGSAGHLRLDVYTIDGRHVATPINGWQSAGKLSTSLTNVQSQTLYLYKLTFEGQAVTGKWFLP